MPSPKSTRRSRHRRRDGSLPPLGGADPEAVITRADREAAPDVLLPERRLATVQLRAAPDPADDSQAAPEPGYFRAAVSVMGNIDSYGDRMAHGSWARAIEHSGLPPVIWSHEWGVPAIGLTSTFAEEGDLAVFEGRLFVDEDEDHQVARQVHAALRATNGDGRPVLNQWSFGFRPLETHWVQDDSPEAAKWGGEIREIHDFDLMEIGPCLRGANQATHTIEARSVRVVERPTATTGAPSSSKTAPTTTEPDRERRARALTLTRRRP